MHPGQKLKPGARVVFEGVAHPARRGPRAAILRPPRSCASGPRTAPPSTHAVDAIGHVPLPPYIKRDDRPRRSRALSDGLRASARIDRRADRRPALHAAAARGARRARRRASPRSRCTSATARSSRCASNASRIIGSSRSATRSARRPPRRSTRALAEGRRVIAVGTTTTRTLEAVARAHDGAIVAGSGATDLFIYPGLRVPRRRRAADELPPAAVVAADAGVGLRRPRARARPRIDAAIAERYRFYSYGDAMLIL